MKTRCYKPTRRFRLNRFRKTCKARTPGMIRDVILYPFGKGQPKSGVEKTPHLLRPFLSNSNSRIHSLGKRDLRTVETAARAMYRIRRKIGRKPCLSMGGDHTVSIGSILASRAMYPDLKIVYFDAHGDINTERSSLTGNKHGMVLSYAMNKGFDPTRLLYVGIRCLDKYEVEEIDRLGISYVTVGTPDIEGKIERFVGNCPTHVSFDVDVLDASIMPWTGLPSKGGLKWEQVWKIAERMRHVVAIDVAELNVAE